jgi:aspartyl-tRNA synthetase
MTIAKQSAVVVDAPFLNRPTTLLWPGIGTSDVAVGVGTWTALHHAFTAPQDSENFDKVSGQALVRAYDPVCNGNEIGGGSMRIHREDIQRLRCWEAQT